MRLNTFRVYNFISFADTGDICLSEGINLIVGQNNAGNSTLLRALSYDRPDERHRNSTDYLTARLPLPLARYDISVSGREIEDSMLRKGETFYWPSDIADFNLVQPQIELFFSQKHTISKYNTTQVAHLHLLNHLHILYLKEMRAYNFTLNAIDGKINAVELLNGGGSDTIVDSFSQLWLWLTNIFAFNAQRVSTGQSNFRGEDRIRSDIGNLPKVLSKLQGEQTSLFETLVDHLREIFPSVQNLNVTPVSDEFEVRVWPTIARLRPELGFSLDNSGTGVSQVIAILVVAMTFEKSV